MSVKKIFLTLVVIVMCIILGAFLINVLLPNVTAQVIDSAEDSIYKETGMAFDFNSDGNKGDSKKDYSSNGKADDNMVDDGSKSVEGFQ
jgi:hypothetical protein